MQRSINVTLLCALCLCLLGCQSGEAPVADVATAESQQEPSAAVSTGNENRLATQATETDSAAGTASTPLAVTSTEQPPAPEPPTWKPEDEPLRRAASQVEAARVLDFRTLPVIEGGEQTTEPVLARFEAKSPASAEDMFHFYHDQLVERGFRAIGERGENDFSGGNYFNDGYLVSLTVSPGYGPTDAGKHIVYLINHGNVNTHQLPVPEGMESFYGTPIGASFITEASVAETTTAVSESLINAGWQPYGGAVGSVFFKQNAVMLMARITSAPAQGGKTVLSFSTNLLSVDLPPPPEFENLQYSDSVAQLTFDFPGTVEELTTHYKEVLQPAGWKATTDNANQISFGKVMIFRNPAGDMLDLEMRDFEGKQRSTLKFKTAAQVAEIERKLREQTQQPPEPAPPKSPKLALKIPANATKVEQSDTNLSFETAPGQARAAVEALMEQLKTSGWTVMNSDFTDMTGSVTLMKDERAITLLYVDTGVVPPQVIVTSIGVAIERAK